MGEKNAFAKSLGYSDFYDQCDQMDDLLALAYNNGYYNGEAVQIVYRGLKKDFSNLRQDEIKTAVQMFKNLSRGHFGDPNLKEVTKEQTLKFLDVFRLASSVLPIETRYVDFCKFFPKEWKRNFGDDLNKFLDKCISDLSQFPVLRPSFMPHRID
jgi:hypothetical protein